MKTKSDLKSMHTSRFLKRCRNGRTTLLLSLLTSSVLFCRQELLAGNIQIDGFIQDIVYEADGTQSQSFTNSFRVSLFYNNWEIKATFGDYAEDLAFDGTNTYTQHYFPPPKPGVKQEVNTAEITTAEIRSGSSCIDGLPPTRVLWVAYCAKSFFNQNNHIPIVSPWGQPALLGADSMTYTAKWLDNHYMIPKTLNFIMSYDFWKKELKIKLRDPDEPNPFKDGELVGEYKILSSTNLFGVTLPTEFELARYAVTRSHKMVVREKFRGQVLAVRDIISPWELPPLHMKAGVQDFRFSTPTQPWLHVSYNTPQAQWLETNDPLVIKGLNAAVTNYAAFEKKLYSSIKPVIDPKKRSIVLLVMLVVFFLPPLFYFLVLAIKKVNSKIKKNS